MVKETEAWPKFDFTKMLEQYKLPGVDFSAIISREKKNIEALMEANKIAFEGWQALVRKQSEILQQHMASAMENARKEDAAKKRVELAKAGFEKALDNMRELAEMAAKSQREAFGVLQKRGAENIEALRGIGKKK